MHQCEVRLDKKVSEKLSHCAVGWDCMPLGAFTYSLARVFIPGVLRIWVWIIIVFGVIHAGDGYRMSVFWSVCNFVGLTIAVGGACVWVCCTRALCTAETRRKQTTKHLCWKKRIASCTCERGCERSDVIFVTGSRWSVCSSCVCTFISLWNPRSACKCWFDADLIPHSAHWLIELTRTRHTRYQTVTFKRKASHFLFRCQTLKIGIHWRLLMDKRSKRYDNHFSARPSCITHK